MALRHVRPVAAYFLFSLAASAAAQAPASQTAAPAAAPAQAAPPAAQTPPTAGEEIVVTGVLPLVVDIEEVAQRCVACRRATERLQQASAAAAAPAPVRRRSEPQALPESRRQPDLGFNTPMNTQDAGARGMMAYTETHTRAGITSRGSLARRQAAQQQVEATADRYLQNLLSYVGPIVDREIQARRAPAAYAAGDPATRGVSTTDITDAVVEHLDRDHPNVDLLAGPRPS